VALIFLELILPRPLLQEPYARVLSRNPNDPEAFLRWLAQPSGALALPAPVIYILGLGIGLVLGLALGLGLGLGLAFLR